MREVSTDAAEGSRVPGNIRQTDTKPRHAKRGVFQQTSEEISTPWGLVCGYYLASSLASQPTRESSSGEGGAAE